ncbi:MAG: ATP synthase F1 subunit epsilon [Bacilli bacterium]|nr:ATP synthase F1 subunit epsilon [Bacilli bacterium]
MSKFLLEIDTPKGVFLKDEVNELYLKTSNGYMGIMAKHDTLITGVEIAPGFILKDNKKEYYAIFGGVLHVSKNGVRLIVSNIEHAASIDKARAKSSLDRARERLKKKGDVVDQKRAELALKRALARLGSVERDFL